MKRHESRIRIALIVLAALVLGGGLMGQGNQPAAAVVPGTNGRIVFNSNRDSDNEIYSMGPRGELGKRGQRAKKLTNNKVADFAPTWSPDGKKIAFASQRDGNFEIYVMNADGSKPTRLTDHAASDELPAWSPDGSKIAFTSSRDGNSEIYVMNANGANPSRLTTSTVPEQHPTWSPDGTRIAFVTFAEAVTSSQVYSMAADGSNPRRLTKGNAFSVYPDWQPKP